VVGTAAVVGRGALEKRGARAAGCPQLRVWSRVRTWNWDVGLVWIFKHAGEQPRVSCMLLGGGGAAAGQRAAAAFAASLSQALRWSASPGSSPRRDPSTASHHSAPAPGQGPGLQGQAGWIRQEGSCKQAGTVDRWRPLRAGLITPASPLARISSGLSTTYTPPSLGTRLKPLRRHQISTAYPFIGGGEGPSAKPPISQIPPSATRPSHPPHPPVE
jgi:hypothetical protein